MLFAGFLGRRRPFLEIIFDGTRRGLLPREGDRTGSAQCSPLPGGGRIASYTCAQGEERRGGRDVLTFSRFPASPLWWNPERPDRDPTARTQAPPEACIWMKAGSQCKETTLKRAQKTTKAETGEAYAVGAVEIINRSRIAYNMTVTAVQAAWITMHEP